jgi:hypothetical protein
MYFSFPFDIYYYYSMQSLTCFSFGYCAIVEDPMAVASGPLHVLLLVVWRNGRYVMLEYVGGIA